MSKHLAMTLYSNTGGKLHASSTLGQLQVFIILHIFNLSATVRKYSQHGTVHTNAKSIYLNILFFKNKLVFA
jgi:hypothetical protein